MYIIHYKVRLTYAANVHLLTTDKCRVWQDVTLVVNVSCKYNLINENTFVRYFSVLSTFLCSQHRTFFVNAWWTRRILVLSDPNFFFLKTYTSSQHSSENVIAWTRFFDTLFFFSLNYEWECWMRMLNANVNVNAKMIAKFNLVINFFYPRFYFLQTLQKLDVVLFLFLCYKWWWCK